MSVYVDSMMSCLSNKKWRHTEVAHLFADSDDELLDFGRRMGLKESWLQRGSLVHFDLTRNARRRVVLNGATEVDSRFVAQRIREARGGK